MYLSEITLLPCIEKVMKSKIWKENDTFLPFTPTGTSTNLEENHEDKLLSIM